MPHVAATVAELIDRLGGSARIEADRLTVSDDAAFRGDVIRDLAWTAAFAEPDGPVMEAARWLIHEAARELGARTASIHELYMARGRGEVSGFTVPAINLRAQTFDMARTVYEAADAADVGAVILELARSEQTYTYQRPADYAASVLAGAIAAGWKGPVFIQGDHYQFNAKKYAEDPEAVTEEIRRACRLAIEAEYRNIDIDSSTLVDLSKPTLDEQQRHNYTRAAELTALIRSLESDGVTISVGGEIGEVGKKNSTEEELRAYLAGYDRELKARAPGAAGLSKVSVQTGTSHGGVPLPDGSMAEVKLDFEVLRRLGEVAREHGLAGAVQHGASTLPDELFHRFPAVETAEIHLATGFQNALFEHPAFPAELHKRIERWVFENAADERKPDQTDQQFVYMTRKKAIGPLKRELWDLETKDEILAAQRRKISFLFTELGVNGSRGMVERYIKPVPLFSPMPDALREAPATARG
ncbi:MAG TPA: class II fructose-bisphosphate aldolase [Candidatus Limnocylindrales bacterium]|nr:class II fructose-bisphosphate aldolase [Candidatus Limnocylindrales bacterium]